MPELVVLEAVLFDLDGTLVDTAPDLAAALNHLRIDAGLPELPLTTLRPWVSQGVRGMLHAGFGLRPDDRDYPELADAFLAHYADNLCIHSRLFEGMADCLSLLESRRIPWGIVTNKRSRFTSPLVDQLGLATRAGSVVSGDTTAEAKPSPLPLRHACAEIGCNPARSCYVGDDQRDIRAGKAAGMLTLAAAYGYLGDCGPVETWGADGIVSSPVALMDWLLPLLPHPQG